MRRVMTALIAAAMVFTALAVPALADDTERRRAPAANIVETAIAASTQGDRPGGEFDDVSNDYDILIQAVLAADLAGALSNPEAQFTVFAPTDGAFAKLVRDLGGAADTEQEVFETVAAFLGGISPDALTDVLLYHVVDRKLGPLQVIFSRSITMLNGEDIRPRFLTLRDQNPDLPDPRLVLRAINIRTSNGVIHTINRVLIPDLSKFAS